MVKIPSAVPFALAALLAVAAMGCAVSLPEPELTATAQSETQPGEAVRGGSGDPQSVSSGAPSGAALSLEAAASDDAGPDGIVALSEDEEAAAATSTPVPATPTPGVEAEATQQATEVPSPVAPTAAPAEPTATPEPPQDFLAYADQMLDLLNERRAESGLAPLRPDGALHRAALSHAQYMAESGFFGHYPPTGSTPAGRIAAAGFRGTYKGEALSAGQSTPGASLRRLLGSPAHARILLEPSAIAVGIGHHYNPGSYYGHYWVVVTGNP